MEAADAFPDLAAPATSSQFYVSREVDNEIREIRETREIRQVANSK